LLPDPLSRLFCNKRSIQSVIPKKPINSGFALADRFIGVPGNSSTIQTYESMAASKF
jgi:hypothetical protein